MDPELEALCHMLEAKGATDEEIDAVLEHSGVKGMKWGVRRAEARAAKGPDRFGNRNNERAQRNIDRVSRVASGTASKGDKVKTALFNIPAANILLESGLKGASQAALDRGARMKRQTEAGKRNVSDILNRMGGFDIRELDYSYTK